MKKNKKKIITAFLVIFSFALSFILTYYYDKGIDSKKNASLELIYEDYEYCALENNSVLSKEDALKEWPFIFKMKNKGNTDSLYQLSILYDKENDMKIDSFNYILFINDEEVKNDKLINLDENILYEDKIKSNKENVYKLYIYKNKEDQGTVFKYSVKVNALLEGGPGF